MAKAKKQKFTITKQKGFDGMIVSIVGPNDLEVEIEDKSSLAREVAYLEAAAELLPRIKAAWKSKKEGEF